MFQCNQFQCSRLSFSSQTESLEHFHVIDGLPPDVCHDLLEGIVPYEIALCLSKFIHDKHFSFSELYDCMNNFAFRGKDLVDKPQPLGKNFMERHLVCGNATENRSLLRQLPLMPKELIPIHDPAWQKES